MNCLERLWIQTNAFGQYIIDISRYEFNTIDRVQLVPVDENCQVYSRYFSQPGGRNPRRLIVTTFEDRDYTIPSAEISLEVNIYGTRIIARPFMTRDIRTRVELLERTLALFPQYEDRNRYERSVVASPLTQSEADSGEIHYEDRLCKNLFPSATPPNEIGR